ncbi:hypothetical protein FLO28_01355 [Escherichia coli]|nr:hypothetical protein [Escherichia coli]
MNYRHAPLAHTDRSRTTDQIGPFTHSRGNEITQILPGYSIPPHRTLRSDITAAPFHARRIKLSAPKQMHSQKLSPAERVISLLNGI